MCAPSVGKNGRATLYAQQSIPGHFAVYTGENANHDVKFVAILFDKFKGWECRHTDRCGLLSKAILTRWIFSGDLTVFRRVRALTCKDPVSSH